MCTWCNSNTLQQTHSILSWTEIQRFDLTIAILVVTGSKQSVDFLSILWKIWKAPASTISWREMREIHRRKTLTSSKLGCWPKTLVAFYVRFLFLAGFSIAVSLISIHISAYPVTTTTIKHYFLLNILV